MDSALSPLSTPALIPTRIGLGGEGVLRTFGRWPEARTVIEEALTQGLAYFDSAPAYAGSQEYYGRVWKERPADRGRVFQCSKSAQCRGIEARRDLENTLQTMAVDHLDLWQIHDVRTRRDFELISGPGGALEAFVQAREDGLTRFIGVTGHHDPEILTQAVLEWPVDAVLMPVNPPEAVIGGFLDSTLPAALEKGLAVIAMKVLGGGHYLAPHLGVTADKLIRFALAQDVSHAIVGCSSPAEVRDLAAARAAAPLSTEEQEELLALFRPQARQLAFYRGRLRD